MIGYGWILKEILKELNLMDDENRYLIKIEDDVANETFEIMPHWHVVNKNILFCEVLML